MKLSVIIIAKNAQEQIADAIISAKFSDEVIVIDGGSQDKTASIAQKSGASVFVNKSDDFSHMRNFGVEKAKGEWIFYLDSDERITPKLAESIKSQLSNSNNNSFVAYRVKRKNFYLGNYEWPKVENLERLFKKENLKGWYGELHESPRVAGEIGQSEGYILHFTHRDLTSMLAKTIEWSRVEAQLRLQAGHSPMVWWRFFRVMITAFFDSYIRQGGWKIGIAGLIESIYQAFSIFVTYARLWEMQQKDKS